MAQMRRPAQKALNGTANGHANGLANGTANGHADGYIGGHKLQTQDQRTDRSRWRLLDESGRHTWHYLETDKEIEAWPQTHADKYHMGLSIVSLRQVANSVFMLTSSGPARSSCSLEAFRVH